MARAKSKTTAKKSSGVKLTRKQIVDRIMQVIEALPESVKDLPDYLKSRKHWEQTLSDKNKRAVHALEMLQELPAFTNQAPKASTTKAWTQVFSRHMGLQQVPGTLREIHGIANQKDAERKPIKRWRDAFGSEEKVQRVRPRETDAYIHNPHRARQPFSASRAKTRILRRSPPIRTGRSNFRRRKPSATT